MRIKGRRCFPSFLDHVIRKSQHRAVFDVASRPEKIRDKHKYNPQLVIDISDRFSHALLFLSTVLQNIKPRL